MKKLFLILVLIGVGLYYWPEPSITHGPGPVAPDTPSQRSASGLSSFPLGDYDIKPLATFRIRARVLSKERYRFGREADLSPVDLALGWGPMSDETVLDEIDISQGQRYYRWSVSQFPVPRRVIETHSANVHLVPANNQSVDALKRVRKGDVVEISGLLIEAEGADGWRWKSSLTREDRGNGACELIYVEAFDIVEL